MVAGEIPVMAGRAGVTNRLVICRITSRQNYPLSHWERGIEGVRVNTTKRNQSISGT